MAWVVSVLAYGDGSYDDDYIVRFFNNHRSARAWGVLAGQPMCRRLRLRLGLHRPSLRPWVLYGEGGGYDVMSCIFRIIIILIV